MNQADFQKGRNTTVRALGYLNGPEQPTPAQALRQAKQDRREMNARKHVAGGSTNTSRNNGDKPGDTADSKPTEAATSIKTATDESASVKTPATTGSDETSLANVALPDNANSENQKPGATNDDTATNGAVRANGQILQKRGSRRKWWGGKGRRHASGNSNKGKDSQDVNTTTEKGEEGSKAETGAGAGMPEVAIPTTAPIA